MGNNIKSIEFIKLDAPASGWSENTNIVKVTDENGLYGIGEADGTPNVIKAYGDLETEHFQLTTSKKLLLEEIRWNSRQYGMICMIRVSG